MSKPEKYRRKPIEPVEVEAMQLTEYGSVNMEIYNWVESHVGGFGPVSLEDCTSGVSVDPTTGFMLIATLSGIMHGRPGYWVVRDHRGWFDVYRPEVFEATFEQE